MTSALIQQYGIYWFSVGLTAIGLYIVIAFGNLVKKLIGLNLFQAGVFILFIALGNITGGQPPILSVANALYVNPVPQVLILTAIVVSVSSTALGLILILRIHDAWGILEEDSLDT